MGCWEHDFFNASVCLSDAHNFIAASLAYRASRMQKLVVRCSIECNICESGRVINRCSCSFPSRNPVTVLGTATLGSISRARPMTSSEYVSGRHVQAGDCISRSQGTPGSNPVRGASCSARCRGHLDNVYPLLQVTGLTLTHKHCLRTIRNSQCQRQDSVVCYDAIGSQLVLAAPAAWSTLRHITLEPLTLEQPLLRIGHLGCLGQLRQGSCVHIGDLGRSLGSSACLPLNKPRHSRTCSRACVTARPPIMPSRMAL